MNIARDATQSDDALELALRGDEPAVEAGVVLARERLAAAARGGRLGWWEWLPDLDVLTGGAAFEDLFEIEGHPGFCPSDFVLGRLHPGDRAAFREAMSRVAAGDSVLDLRVRVLRRDGGLQWLELQGRREHGAPSDPVRVAGIVMAASGGHGVP